MFKINRGEEDYLKQIYKIQMQLRDDEFVTTQKLSQQLKHTLPSINEMIKKLSSKGYLIYQPYKGMKLTKKGEQIALQMVRKHRIWERFLTDHLNYDWDEVDDDAEILEHHTSDRLLEAMSAFLDDPKYCPHGNPIPDIDGEIVHTHEQVLESILCGQYILSRVHDDSLILQFLNDVDLKLGDCIEVVKNDSLNQIVLVQKTKQTIMIGYQVARHLYVRPINQEGEKNEKIS